MTDNKRGRKKRRVEWKQRDEQYEGGRVGTARKSQAKQWEQDRGERRGGEQTDRSALSRMTDE